ncbi:uncharacterized protein PAN0_014c4979 [Moesziomyces antarcticus]|uniref:Uncharacterized protein n=2 Tax=Pseudozyma antarctica TaxID=84753 RepID=A0A081CJB0_PSEA2|nr:uncharacterized protein PAN0_014c4979 [Moesziomyces antarcticus]GAK66756.1 conserved hypothetical protein [Moesziomyces antarcticus]SPO47802.1 uncharacterized protein PSANT_05490 [Moesziomyces antarcticus]
MSTQKTTQPSDAPPSYDQVSGRAGSSSTAAAAGSNTTGSSSLAVPSQDAAATRKSMEDMLRPLPHGWIRQWDPSTHHNFFVDTLAKPPRSIWVHPFDDDQFQREHPDDIRREHERYEREQMVHADTDDEDEQPRKHSHAAATGSSASQPKGLKKFGRSLKDKMTNTTHEEREAKRKAQREAEQRAMQQHAMIRQALVTATRTGQPQFIGKDQQGREIFAQPPPPGAFGGGATLGYGPYQTVGGPYGAYGPYARPMGPYSRPYGGTGMPILGGLAGGMLLGGLLF